MNFLIVDSRFVVLALFFLQGLTKVLLSWLPNYPCFNSLFIVGFTGASSGQNAASCCLHRGRGGCGSVCVSNQHLLSSTVSIRGLWGCGAGIAGTPPFHPGHRESLQLPLSTRPKEFLSAGASSGMSCAAGALPGQHGAVGTRGAASPSRSCCRHRAGTGARPGAHLACFVSCR